MEPTTLLQSIVVLVGLGYLVLLTIMVVISPERGLRRTNRLFRRAIALPIRWLGQFLISLAQAIRGQ